MTTIPSSPATSGDPFALLVDAVVDQGLLLLDPNGLITTWNRGAELITGYASEEVIGQPLHTLFEVGGTRLASFPRTAALLHSRSAWDCEEILLGKGEVRIPVTVGLSNLASPQPAPAKQWGPWGVVLRKREKSSYPTDNRSPELKASQQRFLDLADAIPQIVWTADPDGALNYLNSRAPEYCGISVEGLKGWSWEQVIHPDDLPGALRDWGSALRTGIPVDFQFRIRRHDGVYRWHIARQFPGRDADGAINQWYGTCTDVEDQVQTLEALQVSEQRFRSTFYDSGFGIAMVGFDGKFLRVNPSFCRIVGYSEEELLSRDFALITHPEDLASCAQHFQYLLDGLVEKYSVEKRYVHKQGHLVWALLTVTLLKNSDGTPIQFVSQIQDISEQKAAREALQRSEDRLRSALHAARMGTFDWDLQTNQLVWSKFHYTLFGYSGDHLFQAELHHFADRIHPDDRAGVIADLQLALESKTDYRKEYRIVLPSGEIRWISGQGQHVYNRTGKAIRMLGTVQDITARKLAEQALVDSERKFRSLAESLPDAMFVLSIEDGLRIIHSNPAATKLYGYSAKEFLGQSIMQLLDTQEAADQAPDRIEKILAGEAQTFEVLQKNKEGKVFPVEVCATLIIWQGGPAILGLSRDITQRKQAESAVAESEKKFRVLAEYYLDPVFVLDHEDAEVPLRILYTNPAVRKTHGYEPSELIGTSILRIDAPSTAAEAHGRAERINAGEVIEFEAAHIHRDGTTIPIEVKAGLIPWNGRQVILGINRDISRRKQIEQLMLWQNRVLEQIATGVPLAETLDQIVDLVESQVPGATCSIVLLDEDLKHIRFVEGKKLPAAYRAAFDGVAIGPSVGSCGTAMFRGQPVIVSDIAQDPLWSDYAHIPLAYGLRACWSVPIFAPTVGEQTNLDKVVLGAFAIYHHEIAAPSPQDLATLESAAHLAGVAIGRDRALRAIRDSELRYSLISEITRSVTFGLRITPEGKMLVDWCRPRFGLLSGYTQDEINTGAPEKLFHPDDRARFKYLINEILAGQVVRSEVRYLRKSGETLNVLLHGKLLEPFSPSRDAIIIGGLLDITDLKTTEEALRKSEERFQLAVKGSNDGLWDWNVSDEDGYVYFSPRWKSMLGFDDYELSPTFETWVTLLHPDDRESAMQRVAVFLKDEHGIYEAEFRMRHKAGGYRNILSRAFAIRNEQGAVVRMVGTHQDITERKATELALRQSEEKLRFAQAIAHIGSWTYNVIDQVWVGSLEAERVCGITSGSCMDSEQLLAVAHPDDRKAVQDYWLMVLRGGRHECEYRHIVDGEAKWVHVWGTAECDNNGNPLAIHGITQDITVRRELEERIQQSQKMEAVGQLAGGVAHDFNNLLTVVLGYCNLLLEQTTLDDHKRRPITAIKEAGERAASLTRQLLAFSRKQMLAPVLLSLNELLLKSESMIRRLIREDVKMEFNLSPQLYWIKADPIQVDQVLLNLVVNARDAMPEGGTLTIKTSNVELGETRNFSDVDLPNGQYVKLSITDSGCGIPHDIKTRIFEPFFTTKRVGKGTGLGLSVVHGIVNQSGGHIRVQSTVSVGTQFDLYFPASLEEPQVKVPPSADVRVPIRGQETILIAEDEPVVRQMVRYTLESQGYHVLEAENGKDALEVARQCTRPIHLLLTDVIMPEMGGRQLAHLLRQDRPGIQVIFMSGYIDDEALLRGQNDDTETFLQKPFSSRVLIQKIHRAFENAG